MATLARLAQGDFLDEYAMPEEDERCPTRPLFVASALFDYVSITPCFADGSLLSGGRTPLDHLEQLFCDLRCSTRARVGDMRRMMPTKIGIWKAHAPLLRVFGWCWAPHCFAAVSVALERDLKSQASLYGSHKNNVLSFISQHNLQSTVLRGDQLAVFPPEARP